MLLFEILSYFRVVQALVDLPYSCGITIFPRVSPLLSLFQTLVCPDNVKYNLLRPLLGCVKPIPFPSCSWDQTLQTATKTRVSGTRTRDNTEKNKYTERPIPCTCPRPQSLPSCTLKPGALRTVNSYSFSCYLHLFFTLTLTDITIYLTCLS